MRVLFLANAAPEGGDGGPAAGVSTAGGGAARSDRRVPPESPDERLSHGTLPVRHATSYIIRTRYS